MEESLEIECPVCGQHSKVPITFAGKLGKCPSCMKVIRVPDAPAGQVVVTGQLPLERTEEPAEEPSAREVDAPAEPRPTADAFQPCPYCGEDIRAAAKKCRFCGEFLDRSLGKKRRKQATPDRGWALPAIAPITLFVQALVAVLCAVWVGLDEAAPPVFTLGGFMAVFAFSWFVTALTPFAVGLRLRLFLLCFGNGAGMLTCVIAINALNLRASRPSGVLAAIGAGIALASLAAGILVVVARKRLAAS